MSIHAVGRDGLPEEIKSSVASMVAEYENESGHFVKPETRMLLEHTAVLLTNLEEILKCVAHQHEDMSWLDEAYEALSYNVSTLATAQKDIICLVEGIKQVDVRRMN